MTTSAQDIEAQAEASQTTTQGEGIEDNAEVVAR